MYFRVAKLIFYFKVFLFEQNRKLELRIFLFYMIFLHAWVLSFNVLKLLFFQSSRSFDIMTSKRDLQSYFAKSDNAKVKSRSQKDKPKASCLIQSALNVSGKTEIYLVQQKWKKQVAKINILKNMERDNLVQSFQRKKNFGFNVSSLNLFQSMIFH